MEGAAVTVSERDAAKRIEVIRAIYESDAVVYDPEGSASGHEAINALVTKLLPTLPPRFAFVADGPVLAHHGAAMLRWHSNPAMITGFDVAQLRNDRIAVLHVFISN